MAMLCKSDIVLPTLVQYCNHVSTASWGHEEREFNRCNITYI